MRAKGIFSGRNFRVNDLLGGEDASNAKVEWVLNEDVSLQGMGSKKIQMWVMRCRIERCDGYVYVLFVGTSVAAGD